VATEDLRESRRAGDRLAHGAAALPWEVGAKDPLIDATLADQALTRIRRAYRALQAEEHLHLDRFDGGHRWNGAVAYRVLDKVLK